MQVRDDPVTVIVSKPHDVTEAMTLGKARQALSISQETCLSLYVEILTDDRNAQEDAALRQRTRYSIWRLVLPLRRLLPTVTICCGRFCFVARCGEPP